MCSKAQPQLDTRLLRVVETRSISDYPDPLTAANESYAAMPIRYEALRSSGAARLVESVLAGALARAQAEESLQQAYREIEELRDQIKRGNVPLREDVHLERSHNDVVGNSKGFRRVLKKIEQVAPTDATVLLLGETGTGKELISCKIHELSRRGIRKMVRVNCAALPANLIESELFGRESGAFTGAVARALGRFELAHGSTILLDEIGELPLALQSKLLRVLQEGEFERLGSPRTIKVDVRLIAATNCDMDELVRAGKFREDLFYRLNVFPITVPPLRDRKEDIPSLVWHFVHELAEGMGRSIESIQTSTMEALANYSWPGNVRELRNIIERSLITTTDTVLRVDLPAIVPAANKPLANAANTETLEEVERNHILRVMKMVDWRVRGQGGAAQILCLTPPRLQFLMRQLGILPPTSRSSSEIS
jgi:formate hydrogenlyase transcriptional activator